MLLIKTNDDFSTSVEKALDEIEPNWRELQGTIIVGSHSANAVPEKLDAIRRARESNTPFLGICFGLELAVIEYARNVLKLDADSTEMNPDTPHPVVFKLPQLVVGMRQVHGRMESHWHNYAFNRAYYGHFIADNWSIHIDNDVVEEMRLGGHPYFFLTQYHPEYQSSIDKPHPVLKEFIEACKNGI